MILPRTARRTLSALAAAALLGLAGCGEDDVERNVEEGAKETREAEKQAKEAERDIED